MGRKLVSAVAALALAAVLAACGSGSKPLSAAAFRTQANAVCRDVTQRLMTIEHSTSATAMRAGLARAAAVTTDAVARLEAIDPPASLAVRYDAYKAWAKERRSAALALSRGDALTPRERAAVRPHANGGSAVAHALRLSDCT